MAKRKKASKVQKQASAKRGRSRKVAKAVVAKVKPKPAPVKKAARKVKQLVASVVETAGVEMIERPAPGVITVSEADENVGK
jgi:hypothetical protein